MNTDDAKAMALSLMAKHGLKNFATYSATTNSWGGELWCFKFTNAKRRFGGCNTTTRTITLSKPLVELNDERHVRNTILHEIAHALAPKEVWHGPAWKRIALSIGCTGARLYGEDVIRPPAKWIGTCPNGHTTRRHRRLNQSCGRCNSKYDGRFRFVWTLAE
jgi:SprT protein